MTSRNPRHLAADTSKLGRADTFAALLNRAEHGVTLDEVRHQWQHDIDQWHQQVRRLRLRARVAVGVAVAVALASVAAVVLAVAVRAGHPSCEPLRATAQRDATAGDAR